MTDIQALEHRTDALEVAQNDTTQTLRWAVAKLGRIASVQDEHTLRLEKIETDLESIRHEMGSFRQEMGSFRNEMGSFRHEMGSVRNDMASLRRDMPSIVADAMREVLNKS
jgi:predicted  nucleic acid-binding Zn-ribbon protein